MKKKIISMLMITSLSIALIGCGAEATYVNPVTGEAMDKEEQKELQEMRDELSKLEGYDEFEAEVLGNNNSANADEKKKEETSNEEETEEITIANYLGKELERGSGMGYEYVLYEKGATVYGLETESIPSEIITDKGDTVPVIGIGEVDDVSWLYEDDILDTKFDNSFEYCLHWRWFFGRMFKFGGNCYSKHC